MAAECAEEQTTIEARLARLGRTRSGIAARLRSAGFERTTAEAVGDGTGAPGLTLDAARSADALEKLLAGRTPVYRKLADEIDWVAVNWFDPVLRRWTSAQIRSLTSMTPTQFGALKSETVALTQVLQDVRALEVRRDELKGCGRHSIGDPEAEPPTHVSRASPSGDRPALTCAAASAEVRCREAVHVEAADTMAALRPLNSASMNGEELSVLGPDASAWTAFVRNAAGPATGAAQIYVDGLPATHSIAPSTIGDITVNGDPFSAEYSGVDEIRIDVELRPPDRRWNANVSAPSLTAGGGSPLGAADRPVSRSESIGVSGPVPRLPLTFSAHASRRAESRSPLFIEPESGALVPAEDDVRTTSRSTFFLVSGALVTARVIARARFSGGGVHASHAGIGGADGPTTGQRIDSANRAFQASWRIADGSRVHRGGVSLIRDRHEAVADSAEPLTRVTGQLVTGGDELAASAQRDAAWTLKHVISSGEGTWKAGFEGSREKASDARTPNPRGRFQLDAVDAATGTWIVGLGESAATAHATSAAVFAERLAVSTVRATVRGGVRADWQNGAGVMVAPRVLAVARVRGFQLSGGAGLFVQRWSPNLFTAAALADGSTATTLVLHDVSAAAIAAIGSASGEPLRAVILPGFERRRDLIVRGGIRRSVGPLDAGVEHTWTRGESLAGAVRARDGAGLVDALASDRKLRRHQSHVRASMRRRANVIIAHYQHTWSRDGSDGAFVLPARAGDIAGEWGPSSGVPRHAGSVTAVLRLPLQARLSLAAEGHAGMPYTIITGRDADGLATFTDRGGRPRNDGVLPPSFKLSLFVARTVRIAALKWLAFDAGMRADNLTNHRNITSVGTVAGTPMFGLPLDAAPGRSIRFWVALAR